MSNPDFEDKIDTISTWYIEYDIDNNFTSREIGTNAMGQIVFKAPYKKNLGFWVDNNLTMNDYEKMNINRIPETIFNNLWQKEII